MSNRLQRLLLVVPAVQARPGIELPKLAELLRCDPEELREDIDLLACVGAPPFNPDDLIEIYVDDDRVYVRFAQAFDRPTRLAATEAAALTAAARVLAPSDEVVLRALGKLEAAIADEHRALYDAIVARIARVPAHENPDAVAACERGARERRVVVLDYFARSDLTAKPRRVRPRAIGTIDGVRYLSAVNEEGEERTYRLDRVSGARVTDEAFEPLPSIDLAAALKKVASFERSADLPRATVLFHADVAGAARARHPEAVSTDQGLEARVPYATLPWLVSYVLSWGGKARVVDPPEARAAVVAAVRQAREAHAD